MKTVPVPKSAVVAEAMATKAAVVAEAMATKTPKAAMSTASAASHKRHVTFGFRDLRER